jgi:hypothetical protein
MNANDQLGLPFAPTLEQQFQTWAHTPGGRHVMRHAYRITAGYAARYRRTGRRVSQRLVWEMLRDRIDWIREGLQKRGLDVMKWDGFRLNDHFTAYAARSIVAHRPDWNGVFEFREVGKVRKTRKVLVIEETIQERRAA